MVLGCKAATPGFETQGIFEPRGGIRMRQNDWLWVGALLMLVAVGYGLLPYVLLWMLMPSAATSRPVRLHAKTSRWVWAMRS